MAQGQNVGHTVYLKCKCRANPETAAPVGQIKTGRFI